MELSFDRFYRYADLTAILQGFAARNPGLFRVESIGRSHEGRDIWVVTATQGAKGDAPSKPAFWVDGNIHAAELTASTACLYYLHVLEQGYGKDAEITRLLDTRAIYICPRINPDGAEWALADKPKYIRSSTRPYPFDAHPRSQRRLQGASVGRAADDAARPRRIRRRVLPGHSRGHAREFRRRRDPHQ
ncbi:MAG: M14 family zinc carboxypeptidase, partial [Usitatibacter sp.]